MVISVLNRKLIRDLINIKAQVFSISLIVGLGVAVLFGFTSTYSTLKMSRDYFFKEAKFADLFIPIKKAPLHTLSEIRELNGVAKAEARLEFDALLSISSMKEPGVVHFVSIPDGQMPTFNKIFLNSGRLPSTVSTDEVVVSEGFFKAHKLQLGATFFATLNGIRKKFRIVGVGVSPEYIIALNGTSPFPDDLHFVVAWINQSVLEATFDMRASFNSALVKIRPGVLEEKIKYLLDENLNKYGSRGAYGRDRQISSVFINEELKQLQVNATTVPLIFFLVAAFILNVVLSRLVNTHRGEIATLKALGYFDRSIFNYYFKIGSIIVLSGTLFGLVMGLWIGHSMMKLYAEFYHFPLLSYDFKFSQIVLSFLISILTAFVGVYTSLKNIFSLPPAEAMRPSAPASFHKGMYETSFLFNELKMRARMTIRGVFTFSRRSLMTGLGMSLAIVLLISGLFWQDSINHLITAQYSFVQKETGSIMLTHAIRPNAIFEVLRLPGILEAEGFRNLGVRVHFQNKVQNTTLKGFPENSSLQGIINEKMEDIQLPQTGIFVSRILAKQLEVQEGDIIEIEVLERKKPKIKLEIKKIVDSFLSNELFTSRKIISDLMDSDDLINSILFRSIGNNSELYTRLKELPSVLAISYKDSALKTFNETSAKFLLVFAFILSIFAGAIGFGVVYNNMRVTLAERDWELATLRILGFTIPEVFLTLIAEISFIFVFSIPIGWFLGLLNSKWLISKMSMDAFQIPFIFNPGTFMFSTLILLFSGVLSAAFIFKRVKKMDLVATLKSRG
ncbi:MAG: FtsX-like permease family protein [Bdellovibrionaceae bacterium]|nr:FtsX-like permease family protein [Pseudobdellovibrionaceae bacterium]